MSGPIVRSGPSTKFTQNWAQAFGAKKEAETEKPAKKKAAKAKAKPSKKKS